MLNREERQERREERQQDRSFGRRSRYSRDRYDGSRLIGKLKTV